MQACLRMSPNYSTCDCALQAAAVQLSAFVHVKACKDAYRPRGTIIIYVSLLHDVLDECLLLQSGHGCCHCTMLLLHSATMANKAGQGLNNALLCWIKLISHAWRYRPTGGDNSHGGKCMGGAQCSQPHLHRPAHPYAGIPEPSQGLQPDSLP